MVAKKKVLKPGVEPRQALGINPDWLEQIRVVAGVEVIADVQVDSDGDCVIVGGDGRRVPVGKVFSLANVSV